ncbi:hypothetical protein BON23_5279 [Saccharomyces cerevisiae]|nr:hypothetical protein BON23_5279 [Saccharomyces cerevisiae]
MGTRKFDRGTESLAAIVSKGSSNDTRVTVSSGDFAPHNSILELLTSLEALKRRRYAYQIELSSLWSGKNLQS